LATLSQAADEGYHMKTIIVSLVAAFSFFCALPSYSTGEGLPVSKYLEDSEHKNDILGFYLNAVFSGITLANERANPRIFCMSQENTESTYELIDSRIAQLMQEKRIKDDSTVDEIIMDILIKKYPCK
jgi:hypothetical protein